MIIYMVRNKINNKCYFGQTIHTFDKRYGGNYPKNCSNDHIKRAIEKYGWDNFEVVKEFDKAETLEELNDLEEMYIKMWDTVNKNYGYNKKHGGNNCKIGEELKERHYRRENHPRAKEVHQYTEDGKYVQTWNYIKLASQSLDILDTSIISCCGGKFKSAGGYQWSYEKKDKLPPVHRELHDGQERSVLQYDEKGNFIKEWSSITEASESIEGAIRQHIGKCCLGERKSTGGYQWRYADEVEDKYKNIGKPGRQQGKHKGIPVLQYSIDGEFIKRWEKALDATKELNIDTSSIGRCCKGKVKTAGGYIWKYAS